MIKKLQFHFAPDFYSTALCIALTAFAWNFLASSQNCRAQETEQATQQETQASSADELPVVFQTDFEDSIDNWELVDDGWTHKTNDEGGKVISLFQKQSNYEPEVRSPRHLALLKDVLVSDFQFDCRVLSTHEDYNHRDVCLFFGYKSPTEYYYVHLGKQTDPHANQIFIVNNAARTKISLTTTEGTNWDDDWHNVRITRNAKTGDIKVFFDDMENPVMTAVDKTFPVGRIGLGSFDDTADFDDLKLAGVRERVSSAKITLEENERIVFLGDSITQAGDRPNGYVTLVRDHLKTFMPEKNIEVIGAGISGNKVPDLQSRLERDVLSKDPTIVVIYIGINDVWHSQNDNGTSPADYRAGLIDIIGRIKNQGAKVILCTPTVIGEKTDGTNPLDEMLGEYSAISRQVAQAERVQLLDLRKKFINHLKRKNEEQKSKDVLTSDGVHLNQDGNDFVAGRMIAALNANQVVEEPVFKPTRTVVYKTVGDLELKLEIFEPPVSIDADGNQTEEQSNGNESVANVNRPAIVFFFGGGWVGGSTSQFHPHCDHLAKKGVVAMTANYRVKSRNQTTPYECVADGKSAIRWVRANAAELGIDPDRIAAGGGSAGGHVAAATGTLPGLETEGEDESISSRANALVLFNPVYDQGPGGFGHKQFGENYKEISPIDNITPETPPTIVFLGTKDKLIPVETAERFRDTMEAVGVQSVLHLYEGQPHGFFNFGRGNGNNYRQTIEQLDEFLIGLGYYDN